MRSDPDVAVTIEGAGKRYVLGEREQYLALRDVLARLPSRVLRRARPAERGFVWALRDVSFEVGEGEVVGIVGHNGAGKSTLLKLLSRITRPTEGRTITRGRVGSLLEVGSGFHPELTGMENIYLNGAVLGMRRSEIKAKLDDIVEFSGVSEFLTTPVKRYSMGMYMRLAFAVAAHLEPDILIVDEVLAVGDAEFQKKCLGRMRDLSRGQGRTVLFVSHNMDAVRQLCPRSVWLDGGRVRMDGSSDTVVAQYLAAQTEQTSVNDWIDLAGVARAGSGEARFAAVRYSVDGLDEQPASNRPLRIDVEIDAVEPTTIGSLSVCLTTPGATKVLNIDPVVDQGLPFELPEGRTTYRFTVPALPLVPGAYRLALWLARGRSGRSWSLLDSVDPACELMVSDGGNPTRGAAPGLVSVPYEFDSVASEPRLSDGDARADDSAHARQAG